MLRRSVEVEFTEAESNMNDLVSVRASRRARSSVESHDVSGRQMAALQHTARGGSEHRSVIGGGGAGIGAR